MVGSFHLVPIRILDYGFEKFRARLQTMDLLFVTIKLAPTVDVQMSTTKRTTQLRDGKDQPVLYLHSIDYNPNIQLLPGLEALGITIEVVGDLRPSRDGTGVIGTISFQTSCNLPQPM
jgi:hypothetical protein